MQTDNPETETEPFDTFSGLTLRATLREHEQWIGRVVWSLDGTKLASASSDNTIRIWDVPKAKSVRTLEGHIISVGSVAWSPDGRLLASGVIDNSIRVWDVDQGEIVYALEGHSDLVFSLAWSPDGGRLASSSGDKKVRIWDVSEAKTIREIEGHTDAVTAVVWSSDGELIASGSSDRTVRIWNATTGESIQTLEGHFEPVFGLAWSPDGRTLATSGYDKTIRLWEVETGRKANVLEGHTANVKSLSFSSDGRLLASKGSDDTFRLWRTDTWAMIATVPEDAERKWAPGLAFSPETMMLATLGDNDRAIRLWDVDFQLLIGTKPSESVHHATAKIVLLGDSGVGKTGLGWRLAHGEFKEQPATHGQQFWILDALKTVRSGGAECEPVLWDFAGQPDYRLVHQIFLDDVELALILFDPTERHDPLHGVDFWLKALSSDEAIKCPVILVAGRCDLGDSTLTPEEIRSFCLDRAISGGYVPTSALDGEGLTELLDRMRGQIKWDDMASTVTTSTFKRIKEYVLDLKEHGASADILTDSRGLKHRLLSSRPDWKFSDEDVNTAVSHLAKHGYVSLLRTASGEQQLLLVPDLLNNLAASIVVQARRESRGLGAIDERKLVDGKYDLQELAHLAKSAQDILIDAATVLFLEHNVCFRQSHGSTSYLIFPELINRRKPQIEEELRTEDDVSYTVTGPVENVYAALVVLLGYTNIFTRTDQWHNQAQYEFTCGEICGFRQVADREGELDFVLYYSVSVEEHTRRTFQGLFERFLADRNVTVTRYPSMRCPNPECGYRQETSVVVRRTIEGDGFLFCSKCGKRIPILKSGEEIALGEGDRRLVDQQEAAALLRTKFESAVVQLQSYIEDLQKDSPPPRCFVSYAWGIRAHEQWVEKKLATDLRKAGISVVLDRWDNAEIGANIARFVSLIPQCDATVVVGTPLYKDKYQNELTEKGSVVAAEMDLINSRLTATESEKRAVLPCLLEGDEEESLPPLMHGRVYADFRHDNAYFSTMFDLLLTLYGVPFDEFAVIDLRDSLRLDRKHSSI